jgi:hypothetical protein
MMSKVKYALPAVILLAGCLLNSVSSYAKPEFTKATRKPCTFCHVDSVDSKAKPKELTAAGKYYQEHNNSLEGYSAK